MTLKSNLQVPNFKNFPGAACPHADPTIACWHLCITCLSPQWPYQSKMAGFSSGHPKVNMHSILWLLHMTVMTLHDFCSMVIFSLNAKSFQHEWEQWYHVSQLQLASATGYLIWVGVKHKKCLLSNFIYPKSWYYNHTGNSGVAGSPAGRGINSVIDSLSPSLPESLPSS